MEIKEMVISEEVKSKLKIAGMVGFSVDMPFKYVPKFYRDPVNEIPKELWPRFMLKSKNGIELAEAEDGIGFVNLESKERKYVIESGKARIETLEQGILSVTNFIMEDGTVVSYDAKTRDMIIGTQKKNNVPVKNLIKLFPAAMQTDLQNAINERSQLTAEELLGLE